MAAKGRNQELILATIENCIDHLRLLQLETLEVHESSTLFVWNLSYALIVVNGVLKELGVEG